jgi:hypothetical protein
MEDALNSSFTLIDDILMNEEPEQAEHMFEKLQLLYSFENNDLKTKYMVP